MNIGIVTTWFERGAGYVSKLYMQLLQSKGHNVFIYARGGYFEKNNYEWDKENVTWGDALPSTCISKKHLYHWIEKNALECLFFNEQHEFKIIFDIKHDCPYIKIGSYVDYYTEETIQFFNIYDFLICNTKRHHYAFKEHPQVYYVKWGTDVNIYRPHQECTPKSEIVFFHSMGMSYRKGTALLIAAFINGQLYKNSRLIIHTQIMNHKLYGMDDDDLKKYNVHIIRKTVSAPGLYHLGDVYVYPTILEGLGLTIYEAMSCGMPTIVPNYPPMNEIVNNNVGSLVALRELHARADGYYWPQSFCDEQALISAMQNYINMPRTELEKLKLNVRLYATEELDITKRSAIVSDIFSNAQIREYDASLYRDFALYHRSYKHRHLLQYFAESPFCNKYIWHLLRQIFK